MLGDVKRRLKSLGYKVEKGDDWVLDFLVDKVSQHIKTACNLSEVPEGLHAVAVDMVVGEFLLMKKGSGQLSGLDVEAAVKKISLGDASVSFGGGDEAVTLDGLILHLMESGKSQLSAFRRFAW